MTDVKQLEEALNRWAGDYRGDFTTVNPLYDHGIITRAARAHLEALKREPAEIPTGAIINGRTLIERLVGLYDFKSRGGLSLQDCYEYIELIICFEYIEDFFNGHDALYTAPVQQEKPVVKLLLKQK